MHFKCIFAALALSASGIDASAATATSNVAVSINITASCVIGAGTLSFGTQTNINAANIDATGTFTVNCTNGVPFAVTMNNGSNFSGGSRRMANGTTNFINYTLYLNAARTVLWPATGGTATGTGTTQTYAIFGRIPSGQGSPAAGGYSDTVQMTLTY